MPITVPITGVAKSYPKVIPKITLRNTRKKLTPVKIIDAINLNTLALVLHLSLHTNLNFFYIRLNFVKF